MLLIAWSTHLVGGMVDTWVGNYLPSELIESGLGIVFGIVGIIVLGTEMRT